MGIYNRDDLVKQEEEPSKATSVEPVAKRFTVFTSTPLQDTINEQEDDEHQSYKSMYASTLINMIPFPRSVLFISPMDPHSR